MESVNIEDIMEKIRADIKEKGLTDNEVPFESIPILQGGKSGAYNKEAYEQILEEIDRTSEVKSYRELYGNFIERFVKKVIRRLVAFYIESIVDDQNVFNKNVYSSIVMNHKRSSEEDERIIQLERKVYDCEKRISELENKMSDLTYKNNK